MTDYSLHSFSILLDLSLSHVHPTASPPQKKKNVSEVSALEKIFEEQMFMKTKITSLLQIHYKFMLNSDAAGG